MCILAYFALDPGINYTQNVNKLLKSIDNFKIFIFLKSTISKINAEEGNLHIIYSDCWGESLCTENFA